MTEESFFHRLSPYAATALRYWEPRRIVYNAALAAVVGMQVLLAWPLSRDKLTVDQFLGMFIRRCRRMRPFAPCTDRPLRPVLGSRSRLARVAHGAAHRRNCLRRDDHALCVIQGMF